MGTLVYLRPPSRPLTPIGRLLVCPVCGDTVDVVEIEVGAPMRMRGDLCGACLMAGADPEPALPEPRT